MFFGGWLYPDAPSIGAADAEVTFNKDEFDCAAMGTGVAQATSAATNRKFKAFRTGISSPPLGAKSYFGETGKSMRCVERVVVQFDSGRLCAHARSPSASLRAGSRPAGENAGLRDDSREGAIAKNSN
jgi:hypothetical protein